MLVFTSFSGLSCVEPTAGTHYKAFAHYGAFVGCAGCCIGSGDVGCGLACPFLAPIAQRYEWDDEKGLHLNGHACPKGCPKPCLSCSETPLLFDAPNAQTDEARKDTFLLFNACHQVQGCRCFDQCKKSAPRLASCCWPVLISIKVLPLGCCY